MADVNGDGAAEIIVTAADIYGHRGQLRVYASDAGDPWSPARSVWNQAAYNSLNVNDDLTIPQFPISPATVFPGIDGIYGTPDYLRPYNGFLMQATTLDKNGDPLWLLPDVITNASLVTATASGNSITVTVDVVNQGEAGIGAPVSVALYKEANPQLFNSAEFIAADSLMSQILPGDTGTVIIHVADITPFLPFANIVIRLNDNGKVFPQWRECDTLNNEIPILNPALHLLMKKDATLFITPTDSIVHNGYYSNPVAVLHGEEIKYRIEAVNASLTTQNVIIRDTIPAWLELISSNPSITPLPAGVNPTRDEMLWSISTTSMDTAVVTFRAKPNSDVNISISQPLYPNRAWVTFNGNTVPTNYTWHQGAGVSVVTFSAGFGGNIFKATDQVLNYGTSPQSGILIAPDEGYLFAGWRHDNYVSLRGVLIPAQQGIMQYDTLTIYGNVNLQAVFVPEVYSITYYLNGGQFPLPQAATSPLPSGSLSPLPIGSYTIESGIITLIAPEKAGDEFTGWTGSNGDELQLTVTIPHGSTGEKVFYANYLLSGREEIDIQPLSISSDDQIWAVKNELFVRTTRTSSILRIYSLDGVLQRQQIILQPGETKYRIPGGLYVVTLNNGLGKKVLVDD